MTGKYEVFCSVIDTGSFTKAAAQAGYTQSAVSQTVKALEQELGVTLIRRGKDGISLTSDGESFMPYFRSICGAESALDQKKREVQGLEDGVVKIGTFTSVSRNLLPPLMQEFKKLYPNVYIILRQGDYTSISRWIQEGSVDFGFVHHEMIEGLTTCVLCGDEMMAVLPADHSLAKQRKVTLAQLADEPFILMDEGEESVTLDAFAASGLIPKIEYKVYDDYTILAMVRQGLGVSMMYRIVIAGYRRGLTVRPIKEQPERILALAWQNQETMSLAARRFARFIIEQSPQVLSALPH